MLVIIKKFYVIRADMFEDMIFVITNFYKQFGLMYSYMCAQYKATLVPFSDVKRFWSNEFWDLYWQEMIL